MKVDFERLGASDDSDLVNFEIVIGSHAGNSAEESERYCNNGCRPQPRPVIMADSASNAGGLNFAAIDSLHSPTAAEGAMTPNVERTSLLDVEQGELPYASIERGEFQYPMA